MTKATFLLTPLREGRRSERFIWPAIRRISTHAPAGGATELQAAIIQKAVEDFYSRPCGRGDRAARTGTPAVTRFLLTPLREGRRCRVRSRPRIVAHFYSRPCGRGDWPSSREWAATIDISTHAPAGGATFAFSSDWDGLTKFLLTPLREGRPPPSKRRRCRRNISTHAPAGGATKIMQFQYKLVFFNFYSRPCGRGDSIHGVQLLRRKYFYSRPCGRGDLNFEAAAVGAWHNFYSRPCGRGDDLPVLLRTAVIQISTHAPAGGATTSPTSRASASSPNFYSRPCGRGDTWSAA